MARPPRAADQWLGLGPASRLLGVSQATLRRWADAGRLKSFTTPGGHRRFSRRALERLLPSTRDRRPAIGGGSMTQARLARAYRHEARDVSAALPWLAQLPADEREDLRDLGRQLAWSLVAHLDSEQPETRAHHLAEAASAAAQYGRHGARLGRSLSEVVQGFLAYRRPFLGEVGSIARRRGFDADEVAGLYEDAERALDRLLVATMTGHSVALVGQASKRRHR